MVSEEFDPYDEDAYREFGLGCFNCDGGWKHGCWDDLCRGSNEPEQCENAIPCRHCNPHGDIA